VPAGTTYPQNGDPVKLVGLEPGRKYRVRFGANDAIVDVAGSDGVVEYVNSPSGIWRGFCGRESHRF
jgi:hypothetical protein